MAMLTKWEECLKTGVNGSAVCTYDLQNLDFSGGFFLVFLTKDHRNKYYFDETHPSGLKVLNIIVKNSLMKGSSN